MLMANLYFDFQLRSGHLNSRQDFHPCLFQQHSPAAFSIFSNEMRLLRTTYNQSTNCSIVGGVFFFFLEDEVENNQTLTNVI